MKLMPSSSTVFRIVSACRSVTGRPFQIREPRISIAPKLNRVTSRPVRPKTEVGKVLDIIYLHDLQNTSFINIIRNNTTCDEMADRGVDNLVGPPVLLATEHTESPETFS